MAFEWSQLDTSVGALIRSGAALLGFVLGCFVLAAKPRTRFTWGLGTLLVLDGIGYAIFTLAGGYAGFPHRELAISALVVTSAVALAATGLLLATFGPDIRRLPEHRLLLVSGVVAAAASLIVIPFSIAETDWADLQDILETTDGIAYLAYLAALALSGIALLARVRRDRSNPQARALLLVAAYAVSNVVLPAGRYLAEAAQANADWLAIALLLATSAALVQAPLGFLRLHAVGGWSRWVPIVLLLACLATVPIRAILESNGLLNNGFGGIVSLAGLLGVGYAIFRLDLLGVPVPRPRAGFLAALGLAALFITAQVAQNFLSDQLGLLLGGVVAGAVVFVAYPLQKAAERAVEQRKHASDHGPAAKYRRLVETAWTDGKLGANERLLLAEARRQLGLDAEAASAIDEEVAARHVAHGRASRRAPRTL